MIIDPSLRDMILFIYHHIKNFNSGGGSGSVTTAQLNTALADKVDKVAGKGLSTNDYTTDDKNKITLIANKLDKGGYTGTAQDLKNAIDTVNSKTIHWNDVQNKPELDFIPTSWNKKSGGTIIDTSDEDWLKIDASGFDRQGIDLIDSSVKTTNYYKSVSRDDSNIFTKVVPESIVFSNQVAITKDAGNIAFEDMNAIDGYVYGKFAGVKIGNNSTGNRLLLDNGETKPLTYFATTERLNEVNEKISDLNVGGKNYVLDSKRKRTLNGYVGEYWILTEPVIVGRQYILSCYATVETGKTLVFYFTDKPGKPRQYIKVNLQEGYNEAIIRPNFEWDGLCAYHEVQGISPAPVATVERVKFEIGNHSTDWSPAPEEVQRTGIERYNWDATKDQQNNIVFIPASGFIQLGNLENMASISFRKVFAGGSVTFTCTGKTIIYTGDNTFTGGDGSTAVVSIYGNKCYIDIRNI